METKTYWRRKKQDIQLGWTVWCIVGSNGDQGRVRMGPDFWPEQVLSKRLPYLG